MESVGELKAKVCWSKRIRHICLFGMFLYGAFLVCTFGAPANEAIAQDDNDARKACKVTGTRELTIDCIYPAERNPSEEIRHQKTHIAINKACFNFETKDENYMRIQLTFTNLDDAPIKDSRSIYLLVDDDSGGNRVSRELHNVDFRKLVPGKPASFADRLLMPALEPGRYRVKLWMPSSDPSHKFDATQNLLLQNAGLADLGTRLNAIAGFTVNR